MSESGIDYTIHISDEGITYKIVTSHIYPPIPLRTMDWCAYLDGEEENGEYGYGSTEREAVADLIANYLEE